MKSPIVFTKKVDEFWWSFIFIRTERYVGYGNTPEKSREMAINNWLES